MADNQDIDELHRGNLDLARRDFRSATLTDLDLSGRDFTGAHLEKADLSRSNLSKCIITKAHTSQMSAESSNLSNVTAGSTVVFSVNFKNADLRQSNFSRAHFTRSNLSGANLEGANFRNAVLNEGTIFEGCAIDENTRFDNATIFRPLARQAAFKHYHVERGILIRNDPTTFQTRPPVTSNLYDASSPPKFSSNFGEASFDYSHHDGRAIFGEGNDIFETKWSRAGNESIHSYVNPPTVSSIAIAENAKSVDDFTPDSTTALNYTSRTRQPRKGEILVLRNGRGSIAAIQILEIRSAGHGNSKDYVKLKYRIWSSQNIQDAPDRADARSKTDVIQRVDAVLRKLSDRTPDHADTTTHGGIGHNNPPDEIPLTSYDLNDFTASLRDLKNAMEMESPPVEEVRTTWARIRDFGRKIALWLARKADLAADEFAKQAGKSLFIITAGILFWSDIISSISAIGDKLLTVLGALGH